MIELSARARRDAGANIVEVRGRRLRWLAGAPATGALARTVTCEITRQGLFLIREGLEPAARGSVRAVVVYRSADALCSMPVPYRAAVDAAARMESIRAAWRYLREPLIHYAAEIGPPTTHVRELHDQLQQLESYARMLPQRGGDTVRSPIAIPAAAVEVGDVLPAAEYERRVAGTTQCLRDALKFAAQRGSTPDGVFRVRTELETAWRAAADCDTTSEFARECARKLRE